MLLVIVLMYLLWGSLGDMDSDHICHCETDVVVTVKLLPGRRCNFDGDGNHHDLHEDVTPSQNYLPSEHDLQSFSGTFGKMFFLDLSSLAEWGSKVAPFPCAANATF